MIIHGEQRVRLLGALPPSATVKTVATVAGIYDKGSGALVDLELKSSVDGKLLFENVVSMFVRGEGGFGRPNAAPSETGRSRRIVCRTGR